jgi:hypothetical protein
VNSKKCQNIKLNNNTSLNEEFITEVHWNFPKIYIFNF